MRFYYVCILVRERIKDIERGRERGTESWAEKDWEVVSVLEKERDRIESKREREGERDKVCLRRGVVCICAREL